MAKIKDRRLIIIFWNLGVGGVQTRMVDVVKKVIADGGKVLVLLEERQKNEIKLFESSMLEIRVYHEMVDVCSPRVNWPFRRVRAVWGWLRHYSIVGNKFLWWLIAEIWKFKPDTVLAVANRFSAFAVVVRVAFRLLGRNFRLVINECVVTSKYLDQYENWTWKKIVSWTYPRADKIIVATEAVKSDLVSNFGVRPALVEVVRSWMPSMVINQKEIKKYDGIYVGRLSPEKGIEDLVLLAKEIKKKQKQYKLVMVGEGVMENWLKDKIKEFGLGNIIDYLGYKSRKEVLELIEASRWLLLPSRNEGMPMVVKPFLGVEEVVGEETGLISKMDTTDFIGLTMKAFGGKFDRKNREKIVVKANSQYSSDNLDKFVKVLW